MTAVAEHTHEWVLFPGGKGCAHCPAWLFGQRTALVDAFPTRLIEQPPASSYGPDVTDDLHLDVMQDLLEVARPDISWRELEAMASRLIDRVRGA